MPLFMPTNIVPSTLGALGSGTVDAAAPIAISWQVNGNVPMVAYKIDIMENNAQSTVVFSTDKITLSTPFYGTNAKGEAVFFSHELAASMLVNGRSYKMVITQWWSDTESVTQQSAAVFLCRSAPRITIDDFSDTVGATAKTWTATYQQAEGDALSLVRWRLARQDSLDDPLDDTGYVATAQLAYTYDGLFSGQKYALRCSIETVNGVKADTGWRDFTAMYTMNQITRSVKVASSSKDSGITLQWAALPDIPGEVTGDVTIANGQATLDADGEAITWQMAKTEEETAAFPKQWSLLWEGSYQGSQQDLAVDLLETKCRYNGNGLCLAESYMPYDNKYDCEGIAFGDDMCIGLFGENRAARSADNGKTWTEFLLPKASYALHYSCIATDGKTFIAFPEYYVNPSEIPTEAVKYARSEDGINWTEVMGPSTYGNADYESGGYSWSCCTWGNGVWVAIANSSPKLRIVYSYDGRMWMPARNYVTAGAYRSIAYSPQNGFLAAGGYDNGSYRQADNTLARSPDGILWFEERIESPEGAPVYLSKVIVGPNGKFFAYPTVGAKRNPYGAKYYGASMQWVPYDNTKSLELEVFPAATIWEVADVGYDGKLFIRTSPAREGMAPSFDVSEDGKNWRYVLSNIETQLTFVACKPGHAILFSPADWSVNRNAAITKNDFTVKISARADGDGKTADFYLQTDVGSHRVTSRNLKIGDDMKVLMAWEPDRNYALNGWENQIHYVYFADENGVQKWNYVAVPDSAILSVTLYGHTGLSQICKKVWVGACKTNIDGDHTWNNADTLLLADFDDGAGGGIAGAGTVDEYVVYRMDGDKNTRLCAAVDKTELTAMDCSARTGETYRYYIFPKSGEKLVSNAFVSGDISPCFWDWTILSCAEREDGSFRPEAVFRFQMNVFSGNISNSSKPSVLENFTQFPTIQRAPANYKSGTLSGYLGGVDKEHNYCDTREMRDALYALSNTGNTLFLKNRKGDLWKIAVSGPISVRTEDATRQQAQVASVPWVEVGDAEDVRIFLTPHDALWTESDSSAPTVTGELQDLKEVQSAFYTYKEGPDVGYVGIKEVQVNKMRYTEKKNEQGGISVIIGKGGGS